MFKSCFASLCLLGAAVPAKSIAQSAETLFFLADMRGANESPAVDTRSSGSAVLFVHVMKDAEGRVTSGTVDFNVTAQFAETSGSVVGLHIHRGAAGVNGPVTVDSGISGAAAIAVSAGRTLIARSGNVPASNTAGVDTLAGLLADPNGYYVNLHTAANPGGLFRGQLHRAERRTFLTQLSGANEVPTVDGPFSGLGAFHAFRAFDGEGRFIGGGGFFGVNFDFGGIQRLVGLHIHRGAAGVNGPVVLDSTLSSASPVDTRDTGVGTFGLLMAVPNDAPAATVSALNDLWDAPAGFYMNLHSMTFPGGIIRGQMRLAESITMSLSMSPRNETPAITDLDASAAAAVTVDVLRNTAGLVTQALVAFSVNHRFPGETNFTGLHIHEGPAGVNGPVRIDSGIVAASPRLSANGFGNLFYVFNASTDAALAAVNGLLRSPENFYLNLHTTSHAAGAVRAQMAAAASGRPIVWDFISGVSEPGIRTAAPGGLMTVFGDNLFKVASLVPAVDAALPSQLNGTAATIGGKEMRISSMGWTGGTPSQYLSVQVPFDAAAGAQDVVVTNSNGPGPAYGTNVLAAAPALFFDSLGGIALRPDFTLVRPDSAVRAGEVIGLVATGLGRTTPELAPGQFAPTAPLAAVNLAVTASMGGRPASVAAAFALPGYAGVYSVAIMVPPGLTPGAVATQISVGSAASNNVLIPVR